MPELPEVETTWRDMRDSPLIGEQITHVDIYWDKTIAQSTPKEFRRQILNKSILQVNRRGKYIHLQLQDDLSLLIHLRMSGSLTVRKISEFPDKHDRVILQAETCELAFHDPRKFGRMLLTKTPSTMFQQLGPEPFDETLSHGGFYQRIHTRRKQIKTLLLDQHVIAGIGNIYADESLFHAKIHPCTHSNMLSSQDSDRLLQAIRTVLLLGIEKRGTSLGSGEGNFSSNGHNGENSDNLRVFRKTHESCPNCNTPIIRIQVNQRSTHLCPHCQRL